MKHLSKGTVEVLNNQDLGLARVLDCLVQSEQGMLIGKDVIAPQWVHIYGDAASSTKRRRSSSVEREEGQLIKWPVDLPWLKDT
jgi:hypothetical protein